MSEVSGNSLLLVGLGSPHGDDAVGWQIAERINEAALPGVRVRNAATPLDMLDWLDGVETLVICDACQAAAAPGNMYHWRWPAKELSVLRAGGSHDFGLPAVLQLAERLGRLPSDVRIYGVSGRSFEPGKSLSKEVVVALPAICDRIVRDLRYARTIASRGLAQTG